MTRALLIILILTISVSSCKSPEARRPISQQTGSFIKISAERNKKLHTQESAQIQNIIDKDTSQNYIASESGFWYYYNTKVEKDTITPSFGDIVNFDYDIKDFNGNDIYSDEDIQPRDYAMDQEELFTGLREGLKLMKPGETITFLFPSQKAYGYYGDKNKIGTNTPVICEVTVNSIIQNQND
ncbi:gliding motility-associated peptidyl-prolyl isomerase [Gelidibacter algens]|jgi:gliding motility-associated peptidyl-prolyl isomerase|uniref:Peptidyl-prolyl cis-trans isomerase n=1 Tax=Gelidibacter algens TaxID=49280 RepID=A0A1A7R248_9FLAO|nr:gliding motility-associated peptidyl-prolyl isomerase GldI [Gelidibacter algens]OBX25906.1 gliding motility-associated peptidyl-prolyl isomerase GldI [Gelidibacter algens]RAJ25297.1 gliding motility-associated peptidyl-prolyl isomerase [Gelidibacter algens]